MQKQAKFQKDKRQAVAKTAVLQTTVSPAPIHPILQRTYADPSDITPNEAKILQRTIGNQAVRRLVLQRKMTLGPVGDKYEQEADAVAKQVMQTINTPKVPPVQRQEDDELQMQPFPSAIPSPAISTLQRQEEGDELQMKPFQSNLPPFPFLQRQEDGDELQMKGGSTLKGGELSGDIERTVQSAKSGGRPLGNNIRGSMEQAFSADFSGVKIHTDSQSDTLNRSMNARAFTTGQDIFFRGGGYNPGTPDGQELLAHELTHVAQQNGTAVSRKPVSTHLPIQRNVIQRVFTHDEMVQIAGDVGRKAKMQRGQSTYQQLLTKLINYHAIVGNDNKAQEQKLKLLQDIQQLGKTWLSKRDLIQKDDESDEEVEKRVSDDELRRWKAIDWLMQDASSLSVDLEFNLSSQTQNQLTGQVPLAPQIPTLHADQERERKRNDLESANQLTTGLTDLKDKNKYRFTISAAVQHLNYLKFATERWKNKNKRSNRSKSNQEIKDMTATQVIKSQEDDKDPKERMGEEKFATAVDILASSSGEVGHTWVKFETLDQQDKVEQSHSFGFHPNPRMGFRRLQTTVPGHVSYPDTAYETSPQKREQASPITKQKYKAGMEKAITHQKSPPDYKLVDYNCTKFAKEIASSAGANFPGSAYTRVGLRMLKMWNPNSLYDQMKAGDNEDPEPSDILPDLRRSDAVYAEETTKHGLAKLDMWNPKREKIVRSMRAYGFNLERETLEPVGVSDDNVWISMSYNNGTPLWVDANQYGAFENSTMRYQRGVLDEDPDDDYGFDANSIKNRIISDFDNSYESSVQSVNHEPQQRRQSSVHELLPTTVFSNSPQSLDQPRQFGMSFSDSYDDMPFSPPIVGNNSEMENSSSTVELIFYDGPDGKILDSIDVKEFVDDSMDINEFPFETDSSAPEWFKFQGNECVLWVKQENVTAFNNAVEEYED